MSIIKRIFAKFLIKVYNYIGKFSTYMKKFHRNNCIFLCYCQN